MIRDQQFVPGETYHCFSRGVAKQRIFNDSRDHMRMMLLLLLCNSEERVHMSNLLYLYQGDALIEIFQKEIPENRLVNLRAYALMPNHVHLILEEKTEGGISKFTQKLFTSYSMYFNKRYDRTGPLFEKPFKSRHVGNEAYYRWVFSYVHLNPLDIIESGWKERGSILKPEKVSLFMNSYQWSSYFDYMGNIRPENSILEMDGAPDFLSQYTDVEELISEYVEHAEDLFSTDSLSRRRLDRGEWEGQKEVPNS